MSDRRDWFRSMAAVVRDTAVPPPAWPLPPGALDPADFLARCTGCGDCAEACPHNAIGPISPSDSPW